MASAIGSPSFTPPAAAGTSSTGSGATAAGLQARLDRYQQELSDCVNCDSAKTPAGKQNIQAVSSKIADIKSRIEETTASKPATPPAAAQPATPAVSSASKDASASVAQGNAATTSAPGSATSTTGSRLDVYA